MIVIIFLYGYNIHVNDSHLFISLDLYRPTSHFYFFKRMLWLVGPQKNDDNSDSHDFSNQNSDNVYSDDTHEVGIKRITKVKIRIIPIWIPAIVGVKIQGAMIFIGPKKPISIKDYWKYARCVIAKLQLSGENSCWLRPTCLETSQWYLVISCDISILRHVPVMRGSCFNGTPRLEEKILATQVKPKRVSPPRGCGNQSRKSVLFWFWDHQISSGFSGRNHN